MLPGPVNEQLADFASELPVDIPVYLQLEIATALGAAIGKQDLVIEKPRDPNVEYLDTWEVLQQAREKFRADNGEHEPMRPILIGQASHIGRIAAQAAMLGMEPIVPEGLPRAFDSESKQWWTRSRLRWIVRELPALFYFRRKGQI